MPTKIVVDNAQDQLNTLSKCTTDYERLHQYQQPPTVEFAIPSQQALNWNGTLEYDVNAAYDGSVENYLYPSDNNVSLY